MPLSPCYLITLVTDYYLPTGRNAMSQIWYNSEITGTIIVQCIPILRPIIWQLHRNWTENRTRSTTTHASNIGSKLRASFTSRLSARLSPGIPIAGNRDYEQGVEADTVALKQLPSPDVPRPETYHSIARISWKDQNSPSAAIDAEWPRTSVGDQGPRNQYDSGRSLEDLGNITATFYIERDIEDGLPQPPRTGLSPPPPRR